jgi:hypothetical protein
VSSSPTCRLGRDEGEGRDDGAIEDADMDATLASSIEADLESKPRSHSMGISSTTEEPPFRSILHGTQLATPASSVGSPEADIIPRRANVSLHWSQAVTETKTFRERCAVQLLELSNGLYLCEWYFSY